MSTGKWIYLAHSPGLPKQINLDPKNFLYLLKKKTQFFKRKMFYFCLKELITWYTHLTHPKTARFLLKKISYTYPKNTIIQTKNIFQMHEKKTIYLPRTSKKY